MMRIGCCICTETACYHGYHVCTQATSWVSMATITFRGCISGLKKIGCTALVWWPGNFSIQAQLVVEGCTSQQKISELWG